MSLNYKALLLGFLISIAVCRGEPFFGMQAATDRCGESATLEADLMTSSRVVYDPKQSCLIQINVYISADTNGEAVPSKRCNSRGYNVFSARPDPGISGV